MKPSVKWFVIRFARFAHFEYFCTARTGIIFSGRVTDRRRMCCVAVRPSSSSARRAWWRRPTNSKRWIPSRRRNCPSAQCPLAQIRGDRRNFTGTSRRSLRRNVYSIVSTTQCFCLPMAFSFTICLAYERIDRDPIQVCLEQRYFFWSQARVRYEWVFSKRSRQSFVVFE